MSVTIQCIKRADNMSSLSSSKDTRRKSLRRSAGQMLIYLAREYDEHKRGKGGKKLGGGGKKRVREGDRKVGPLTFLSSESLLNDDSNMSDIVPRKKSRGASSSQKSGGGKSIGVLRVVKGAKVKKLKTGAKRKKTLDCDSVDFSSSDDLTLKATIVKSMSDSMGKHSVKELLKKIEE